MSLVSGIFAVQETSSWTAILPFTNFSNVLGYWNTPDLFNRVNHAPILVRIGEHYLCSHLRLFVLWNYCHLMESVCSFSLSKEVLIKEFNELT